MESDCAASATCRSALAFASNSVRSVAVVVASACAALASADLVALAIYVSQQTT
jgi:hypothetical protein